MDRNPLLGEREKRRSAILGSPIRQNSGLVGGMPEVGRVGLDGLA